jgi:hypothetical protein
MDQATLDEAVEQFAVFLGGQPDDAVPQVLLGNPSASFPTFQDLLSSAWNYILKTEKRAFELMDPARSLAQKRVGGRPSVYGPCALRIWQLAARHHGVLNVPDEEWKAVAAAHGEDVFARCLEMVIDNRHWSRPVQHQMTACRRVLSPHWETVDGKHVLRLFRYQGGGF